MPPKTLISSLNKLASCSRETPNRYLLATDVLWEAWKQPKPLFADEQDKTKAAQLVERSLSHFRYAFAHVDSCLEPDLIDQAQSFRSGLQFLFDEFRDNSQFYDKFVSLLECESIKSVEDYIRENKDAPLEYPNFSISSSDKEKLNIPTSHYWWM